MEKFISLFNILMLIGLVQSEQIFDVTKYGADSRGVNKSTEAVANAISAAVAVGGGTVYFPDGQYLSGPIHLKSNITLHLEEKAIIKFSTDFDDYLPMVPIRWEGTVLNAFSPLIYAYKQENIAIKRKGIIDGQGQHWFDAYTKLKIEYYKTKTRSSKYQQEFLSVNNLSEIASETNDMTHINIGFLRPPFIQPFDCKNILIEDITVKNSPFWNINPVFCENVTIKAVKIKAPSGMANTDGIDPDSCKDVLISDAEIDVGDDCIAIKSGIDLQGRRIGRPSENVVITNCKMLRGHSAVAIGSDMSGGVKNVTVKDCVFNGTDRGLYIKSTRGRGGVVEDIHYKNVSMTGIRYHAIELAMYLYWIRGSTKEEPFSDRTPVFRNIRFEDIRGEANDPNSSIVLSGLKESLLDNIELKNIEITSESGLSLNFTTNLKINGYNQKTHKSVIP